MSGHSKWSTIKHRKGAQDAKRGKVFTKIIREIITAVRSGGSEPESNPRLRVALQAARAANMPKDNVNRAIERGTGASDSDQYFEIQYEGYGPKKVALIVNALTDNKNRTAADVRSAFNKYDGNLGESGCVSYLFDTTGVIVFDATRYSEEQVLEAALEAGGDDVRLEQGRVVVLCSPRELHACAEKLIAAGLEYETAHIVRIPQSYITLSKAEAATVMKLIESLEDLDDIQEVHSNLSFADNDGQSE